MNQTPSENACYEEIFQNKLVCWTFIIILSLLIIFSLVGNTLVCIALAVEKSLRTPANTFLLNMSVGDIIVTSTVVVTDWTYLMFFPKWILGAFGNWIYNIGFLAFLIVPFLTLIAVTVDRYVSIVYPLRYILLVTRRRVAVCLFLLWFYTFVIITVFTVFLFPDEVPGDYWKFLISNQCYIALLVCHTFLPLVVIVILNIRIYLVALRHSRQIAALLQRFLTHGGNVRYMMFELKATRTVWIVIVILVISWFPFILNETLYYLLPERLQCSLLKLGTIANYVTYLNGALNPVVYALRHRRFFLVFKKIVCCTKTVIHSRRTVAPVLR